MPHERRKSSHLTKSQLLFVSAVVCFCRCCVFVHSHKLSLFQLRRRSASRAWNHAATLSSLTQFNTHTHTHAVSSQGVQPPPLQQYCDSFVIMMGVHRARDGYNAEQRQPKAWQNKLLRDEALWLAEYNKTQGVKTGGSCLILDANSFATTDAMWQSRGALSINSLEHVTVPNPARNMVQKAVLYAKKEMSATVPDVQSMGLHHYLTKVLPLQDVQQGGHRSFQFTYLDYCGTWRGRHPKGNRRVSEFCDPRAELASLFESQRFDDGAVLGLTLLRARNAGLTSAGVCGSALAAVQYLAAVNGYGIRLRAFEEYMSPHARKKTRGSPMLLMVCWIFKRHDGFHMDVDVSAAIRVEWQKRLAIEVEQATTLHAARTMKNDFTPILSATMKPQHKQPQSTSEKKIVTATHCGLAQVGEWFILPGRRAPAQLLAFSANGSKRFQTADNGNDAVIQFWHKCSAKQLQLYRCIFSDA